MSHKNQRHVSKKKQKELAMKGFKYFDNKKTRATFYENCSEEVKQKIAAETAGMSKIPIDLGDFLGDEYKGEIIELCDFTEQKDKEGNILYYYKVKSDQFLYLLTKHPDAYAAKERALKEHMDSISLRFRNGIIIDETKMLIFTDAKECLREAAENLKDLSIGKGQPGIHPEMESIKREMFEDGQEE